VATIDGVRGILETAAISATSATDALEMGVSRDRAVSGTALRVMAISAGVDSGESNVSYDVARYRVEMLHRLSSRTAAAEETYLAAATLDQRALMLLSFWRGLSGVNELVDVPTLEEPQRTGRVIEYNVTATVSLEP